MVNISPLVVSDSLRPHGLQPTTLLHPWDFRGKSTGVDCHFLLQRTFPTQGSNPGLLHCRQTLYRLSHQGSLVNSHKRAPKTIAFWFDSTSLVAQTVKRLPTMWETRLQSLGWEDPLEKEMATHSSTLAWKTPWMEESSRLHSTGSQRVQLD